MMSKAEHAVHNQWFEWITKRQQPQLDLISKQAGFIKGFEPGGKTLVHLGKRVDLGLFNFMEEVS